MYNIELIKNLLIKTTIDGNHSVCDTCIHQDDDKSCRYRNKNKCTNGLEEYVPSEEAINYREDVTINDELICPKCNKELHRQYVNADGGSGYDFTLGIEYSCECGYERVDS